MRILALLMILAAATHAGAAEPSNNQRRPNIVLLLADDQRPDTIHALGNPRIETPNLDRLVAEGTAFTRAITAFPICLQSRIELMTGCTIWRGEKYAPAKRDTSNIVPWAETLRRAGYRTWHVGKWHNAGTPRDWGYEETRGLYVSGGKETQGKGLLADDRGRAITGYRGYVFKTDDGQTEVEKGIGLTPNISDYFGDAAVEFIDTKPDAPFFLHVNFAGPHDPLLMPPKFAGKYRPAEMAVPANFLAEHPFDHGNLRGRDELLWPWPRQREEVQDDLATYYAVISHLDQQVGRVLAALERIGQLDNTLLIYTSDQGLAIGSHGLRGKQNMYEHTIEVPLVMRGPGVPRDVRCNAQVYLRDLYPTTCQIVGVDVPPSVEGKSFVPVLRGEVSEIHRFVVAYFRDVQRMIRTDRWKLIEYPQAGRTQLFDVKADPDELHDLSEAAEWADTRAKLHEQLHSWLREHGDPLEAR
ncbi:MAG TPA: sulfatase-like hydrolase/transferase [Pirellulales bacterium]|jgi:arylsulfatase A-like enzyme|nr:sulfatase-like hydrolase/transferase [Pirellulales bacterium]